MIGVGIAANFAAGHHRSRVVDPAVSVTTFEEGATLLVVYGTALAVDGRPRLLGAEAVGSPPRPTSRSMPLALLGRRSAPLLAVVAAAHRRLPRPGRRRPRQRCRRRRDPGDRRRRRRRDLEDRSRSSATASWRSTVLAFVGLLLKTFTGDGRRRRRTTRTVATRSSGAPRRRRRPTTTTTCRPSRRRAPVDQRHPTLPEGSPS